jgi:DMSO/TMAO reductase YedYZ molybdopterin-dependent catalytic subunit
MKKILLALILVLALGFAVQAQEREFEFGEFFDGLHVTGKSFDLNEETYRLTVTGKITRPLSLSFAEVKALPAVRRKLDLICVDTFTDSGDWTGVTVKTILQRAGIRRDAKVVIFSTPDDSYRTRFTVEDAFKDDMLIAYEFNGRQFHRVHGFPLRLAAGGHDGSNWVKWLSKIVVE